MSNKAEFSNVKWQENGKLKLLIIVGTRPEALDKACFILSDIDEKGLLQSVDTAVTMNQNGDYGIPVPGLYRRKRFHKGSENYSILRRGCG